MGNVTESIFNGKSTVIPMADVSHIEKEVVTNSTVNFNYNIKRHRKVGDLNSIVIITKHTTWQIKTDEYHNACRLVGEEATNFLKAWCMYRHELEKNTIKIN